MSATPERSPRPWPRFMTASVAADYAHTSPWTIRRHVRACGRRGRALVFAIEDVDRWMQGEALAQAAPAPSRPSPRPAPSSAASAVSLERIRTLARDRGGARGVAGAGEPVSG